MVSSAVHALKVNCCVKLSLFAVVVEQADGDGEGDGDE